MLPPFTLFLRLIILAMVLIGCTVPKTQEYTPTVQPTLIPIPSATPTPDLTPKTSGESTTTRQPSDTPIPSHILISQMLIALQSPDCTFPCYLGIEPGKTTIQEAKAILARYGGNPNPPSDKVMSNDYYHYSLWVTSTYFITTPEAKNDVEEIFHDFDLLVNNNIIQNIEVRLEAVESSIPKLRELWPESSLQTIFLQYGAPNQIYLDSTSQDERNGIFSILLDYQQSGFRIELSEQKKGSLICPQSEGGLVYITFHLYNPDPSWRAIWVPPIKLKWVSIENILGIDKEMFYGKVITDQNVCFSKAVQPTN